MNPAAERAYPDRRIVPPWGRLLDDASDGIVVELAERVVYVNRSYAVLLGYRSATDLVDHPISELIAPIDSERLLGYGRMRASGRRVPAFYDFAARCRDGSTVRLHASVSLSIVQGRSYITTIARPFPASGYVGAVAPIAGLHSTLSEGERKVMEKMLQGTRPKVIAFELGVSEKTVAAFRARILAKIGLADNRELFQYAVRHALIDWS